MLQVANGGNLEFQVNTTGWGGVFSTTDLQTDTWYHLAATYDGSDLRLYINGVEDASSAKTGNLKKPYRNLYVGVRIDGGSGVNHMTGAIDELHIYDQALSGSEVAELYLGYSRSYSYDEIGNVTNLTGASYTYGSQPHAVTAAGAKTYVYDANGNMTTRGDQIVGVLVTDGLVGRWPMDEDSGSTAFDTSVNSNDGTLTNGPTRTSGFHTGALEFDDIDDYVDMGAFTVTDGLGAITVSAWVNMATLTQGAHVIASKWDNDFGASQSWLLQVSNGTTDFQINTTGWAGVFANTGLQIDTWSHLAATYDGSDLRLYINGVEDASSAKTGNLKTPNRNLYVGVRFDNGTGVGYMRGAIDELRIYDRALTAAEVQSLYDAKTIRGEQITWDVENRLVGVGVTDGLIGRWSLDEGSGSTAFDTSDNSNDGTASGTSWAAGQFSNALDFDGTDDYVDMGAFTATDGLSALTVSAWVNLDTVTGGDRTVASKWDNPCGACQSWLLSVENGSPIIQINTTGWAGVYATTDLQTDAWYHLAATYDGSDLRIYVNGVEEASTAKTGNLKTPNRDLYVGVRFDDGTGVGYMDGSIDELRIYNRALTASEVQSLNDAGAAYGQYTYDPNGRRVTSTEGEKIAYYNKYLKKNLTTGEVTKYYYLGGKLVAQSISGTLSYYHKDHLTGTNVMTDSSGNEDGTVEYYPYGVTRSSSGTIDTQKRFTGQHQSSATGLYYYNARWYDPDIGRFISADIIVPNPRNPQDLNRYGYARNNPLKYIDPSGHDIDCLTCIPTFEELVDDIWGDYVDDLIDDFLDEIFDPEGGSGLEPGLIGIIDDGIVPPDRDPIPDFPFDGDNEVDNTNFPPRIETPAFECSLYGSCTEEELPGGSGATAADIATAAVGLASCLPVAGNLGLIAGNLIIGRSAGVGGMINAGDDASGVLTNAIATVAGIAALVPGPGTFICAFANIVNLARSIR